MDDRSGDVDDSLNGHFVDEGMVDMSHGSGHDWFLENWFVRDSLDGRRHDFDSGSDGPHHWLDVFLVDDSSSWNVHSLCVNLVGDSWSLNNWFVSDHLGGRLVHLNVDVFSFDDWLDDVFVVDLGAWDGHGLGSVGHGGLGGCGDSRVSDDLRLAFLDLDQVSLDEQ